MGLARADRRDTETQARQAWHEVEGKVRTDEDWHGNAGEVRQGSEAKGNAGRIEVRQARKVGVEFGKDDTESRGTAGTESSGGSWSGLESPVLDRSGKAGEERLGEVGCGLQRQDAAGVERTDEVSTGEVEQGMAGMA